MRLNGRDVLMMKGLSEDIVFPFVSYAGSPTKQPGTAIGGYGIGNTWRNKKYMDFRVKSVSGGALRLNKSGQKETLISCLKGFPLASSCGSTDSMWDILKVLICRRNLIFQLM